MTLNKKDLENIKDTMKEVMEPMMAASQKEFDKIDGRLKSLERGQEDIILKLDNVAYRFELVALQKRVEVLEKRAGVKQVQNNF